MINDVVSNNHQLLSLCAILQHFDYNLLLMFVPDQAIAIAELIASDDIITTSNKPDMFQLRQHTHAKVLAQLRAEHPDDELHLHEHAFHHFLHLMRDQTDDKQRTQAEVDCFYHLDALRMPLIERREWLRIRHYIVLVRDAKPQILRHLHLLILYDGLNAVRSQQYSVGEALLTELLEHTNLADDLRMRALNVLAQSYWFQTWYDRALTLYQQVYTLACTRNDQIFQGHALLNIAMVYHEIGDYAQALELSQQSLNVYQLLNDVYHEAHASYEVAKNAMELGNWEIAQHYFLHAATRYETLDAPAQLANVFCLQAILQLVLGDEAACEAGCRRSLEIGQSPEYGDVAVTVDAWRLLGMLYHIQHRWQDAFTAYEQAATAAQNLHNTHRQALIDYRRGVLFQTLGHTELAEHAYQRAIEQLEALRGNAAAENIKLGLFGASQHVYEAMVLLLIAQDRIADAYHIIERARLRAFLDMLAQKSPELYDSFDQQVVTLSEVQSQLPPHALLIEYYTTGVLPADKHNLQHLKASNPRMFTQVVQAPHTFVFAVSRDHAEVHEIALDPNVLQPAADAIHPGYHHLSERQLRLLHTHLIEPVRHLLDGRSQIFLIPHGPLHRVPFLALRGPDHRYLLDRNGPAIAFAPSATLLLRNCFTHPPVTDGTFLSLGYNDPQVGLQQAESEARAVARLVGGIANTGAEPKAAHLIDSGLMLRGLHIAGHASYDPHDPLGSHISLGNNDILSARTVLQSLNLRPILVSLSACTSGMIQIAPGDEMFGLLRSWLYAGATTVVCVMWDAADIAARVMMEHFYRELAQGTTPGFAFRNAVVALRELTGREVADLFTEWRKETADIVGNDFPDIPPELYSSRPYDNVRVWAPFMLIGRP